MLFDVCCDEGSGEEWGERRRMARMRRLDDVAVGCPRPDVKQERGQAPPR